MGAATVCGARRPCPKRHSSRLSAADDCTSRPSRSREWVLSRSALDARSFACFEI